MDKIIVHSTYYNSIEASIVKSKLDDSEILCFLTDENVATLQPLYNQAIGGVKLNIFERDLAQVNKILAIENNVIEIENEANSNQLACEQCGSDNLSYGLATKNKFSWWVAVLSIILLVSKIVKTMDFSPFCFSF